MQGGWSNADSDWQLKRLQHDSVKTVDKAVQTMRGVLQEDIIAHGQEYEKMFGKSSAQYNEYLNMVMEKLEQLGVAPKQVIEWLNQTASDGAVPVSQYGTDRDSQSETIPQIRAEPIPYDQQLQPQVDFDSFARLEAAASQALAVGTNPTPASALPFSAFPAAQVPAPLPTPTSFPSAQPDSSQSPSHSGVQAPAPAAQPTFQSSLLSNSAAWGSPTPGQNPSKPAAVAEAWGLGASVENEPAKQSPASAWGSTQPESPATAPKGNSSWGTPEPNNSNSLKSALGMAASPVVQSASPKPPEPAEEEFNYETTWQAVPVASAPISPATTTNLVPQEPAWNAAPATSAPAAPQASPWSAAPAHSAPAMPQEPAWTAAPAPPASSPAAPISPIALANNSVNPIASPAQSNAQSTSSSQAFTQWGAPTSVSPPAQSAAPAESPWVTAAAPTSPAPVAATNPISSNGHGWASTAPSTPTAAPSNQAQQLAPTSTAGWASPAIQSAPAVSSPAQIQQAPGWQTAPAAQAMAQVSAPVPGPGPAPAPAPLSVPAPAEPVVAMAESNWNTPAPVAQPAAPGPIVVAPEPESPWTAAAHSLAAESQWAAPPFPIPSPTLGPALTPALMAGPMMAPISQASPLPPAPIAVPVPAPSPVAAPAPVRPPAPAPVTTQAPVFAAPQVSPVAVPPSPWGAVPAPTPAPAPVPMQAVAPVVSVAPVIPVATQMPANDQSPTSPTTRPSFGGWPAGPVPNPYATQDAMQRPQQQQQQQPVQQPQQVQQPASPPTYGWAQPQQQQQMQNSPIAAPHYQNPGNGSGGNGHQMQRPEEREEPSYDPATAWD